MTTLSELAEQSRGHSIFSPSGASRWTRCPGSLVAHALAPDKTSEEAAEGTVAHAMADQWLRTGQRPASDVTIVEDGYEILVDDDMLAFVEQYVDWVQDCRGTMYFEQRVDFSQYMPIAGQGGTADHFSSTFGELTITDLKYGRGVRVDVRYEDGTLNPQLMLYALGVFLEWDWYYGFERINLRVCQPRLDHQPFETISRAELLSFADWIAERARAAWVVDAPREPGAVQCKWCAAKRDCPAYVAWFRDIAERAADDAFGPAAVPFGVADLTDVAERTADPFADERAIVLPTLSVEAWCAILPMRSAVEAWFAAGEAKVFQAALDGDAPGYKVVEGRANRNWIDPDKAKARMVEVGILLDETETRKLISPNQAEDVLHARTKMGKKKARDLFDVLTERQKGSRSLVVASDKREAIPSYGDVFD